MAGLVRGTRLAIDEAMSSGRDAHTFAIIGAAMEVHRILGSGYVESYFRDALRIEFDLRRIPFRAEVPCVVEYKGHLLSGAHRVDFVCYELVVVEVKARSNTGPSDHAQVLNYLAATKLESGLLLNFGTRSLEYRRFALSRDQRG